jgi:hypothetical protein
MLDLLVLSNAVNFVGVAMALWLGFINLTRSPRHTLTRAMAQALTIVINLLAISSLLIGNRTRWRLSKA